MLGALIYTRRAEQEASAIKGKKGYIELRNQTNGMYFTTKTLKALNEEKTVLKKEYDKKQSTLVKEVITIAGERKTLFRRLYRTFLTRLCAYSLVLRSPRDAQHRHRTHRRDREVRRKPELEPASLTADKVFAHHIAWLPLQSPRR